MDEDIDTEEDDIVEEEPLPTPIIPVVGASAPGRSTGRRKGSKNAKKTTGTSTDKISAAAVAQVAGEDPKKIMVDALVDKMGGGNARGGGLAAAMKPLEDAMAIKGNELVYKTLTKMIDDMDKSNNPNPMGLPASNKPLFDLSNPESIKMLQGMDEETIMKINLMNSNNPMAMLLMSTMGNKKNADPGGMQQIMQLMALMKTMQPAPQPQQQQPSMVDLMKVMLEMTKAAQPQNGGNEALYKTMLNMFDQMNNIKTSHLMEKIQTLEQNVNVNPLDNLLQDMDKFKNLSSLFGNRSPESMSNDLEIRKLQFEMEREARKEDHNEKAMEGWTNIAKTGMDTIMKTVAEPIGEGFKSQMQQRMQAGQNPFAFQMPQFQPQPQYPQYPMSPQQPQQPQPSAPTMNQMDVTGDEQQEQPIDPNQNNVPYQPQQPMMGGVPPVIPNYMPNPLNALMNPNAYQIPQPPPYIMQPQQPQPQMQPIQAPPGINKDAMISKLGFKVIGEKR